MTARYNNNKVVRSFANETMINAPANSCRRESTICDVILAAVRDCEMTMMLNDVVITAVASETPGLGDASP